MRLWERILNLLFPPKCPFCGKLVDRPGVCAACEKTLPWVEAEQVVRPLPDHLSCAAPLWYEGAVREGLLRFKFSGVSSAAVALGEVLAQCAAEEFSGEFDRVTWVPVSQKRLRKRGYDQAELLAREACRLWQMEPVRLLNKVEDNPAQSGLHDEAARRANVLGVYDPASPEQIRGRNILLIDDICTTGATLRECARVLESAGAEKVVCACVAQTRKNGGNASSCGRNSQEKGAKSR